MRAGEGPAIWAASDTYTIKATATQTGGVLGFLDASVPPGGGPEPHAHHDQDETFYVLSGELEFLDGDRTFTAVAGPARLTRAAAARIHLGAARASSVSKAVSRGRVSR